MPERPRFAICRVPRFGLNYSEARYYGWHYSVQIGWWIVFFSPVSFDPQNGGSDDIDF